MDNFIWNDELVKDFCEYVGLRVSKSVDIKYQIRHLQEDFKKLHSTKEDPPLIKVDIIIPSRSGLDYSLRFSSIPEREKLPSVKKDIEGVLNETLVELTNEQLGKILLTTTNHHKEELLQTEEHWYNIGKGVAAQNSPDYKTYKNSLK